MSEEEVKSELQDNNSPKIFKYFDGFNWIYGDPFEIDYKFQKASETEDVATLDSWLRLPRDDEGNLIESKCDEGVMRLYNEAQYRYVPMVQKAFGLKPFNKVTGEGLTMSDVIDLWSSYLIWKFDLKKNTEDLPTAATPST
jgi:hypothetical protein